MIFSVQVGLSEREKWFPERDETPTRVGVLALFWRYREQSYNVGPAATMFADTSNLVKFLMNSPASFLACSS